MAQVLAAVPTHGLEAVLVAVELVLESGATSSEHVLNVLARLQHPPRWAETAATTLTLQLSMEPDLQRYDHLRKAADHVH